MNKTEATLLANSLLNHTTVDDLAKQIGITKPTLYVRLRDKNWKLGEIALLEKLKQHGWKKII